MSETILVLEIDPGGYSESIQSDDFPLKFLGDMSMHRASVIKFNDATQLWDVFLCRKVGDEVVQDDTPLFTGYEAYEEARKAEIDYINRTRLETSMLRF